jgi:hypothetical protein
MLNHRQAGILLSLLAPRSATTSDLEGVGTDWGEVLVVARQHRLRPLLQWRLRGRRLPRPVELELAESARVHTLRSLELRGQLITVQRILSARGIPAVFLKGAFLAFHAYPHPALRPLRDLDVLVPRARSVEAFEALLTAGFSRSAHADGSPVAAATCRKHLPGLVSASGEVLVELHTRLFELLAGSGSAPGEGAERVAFLSPADQLLHLIVHALFDHHLSNGPLTLADIAFLLESTAVDWPVFWRMAAAGGWVRGCWLLLSAVDRLYAPLRISPPSFADMPAPPEKVIAAVGALMFADNGRVLDVLLSARIRRAESMSARVRLLLGRLYPSPLHLASTSAQTGGAAGAYVRHWWRLATVRLPEFISSRRDVDISEETAVLAGLQSWLGEQR